MERSEIKLIVSKFLVEGIGADPDELKDESNFKDDLGMDSLDGVELIMKLEVKFNIGIPDDDAEEISTLGQAVDYLEKRLTGKE